jgi:hypothetical protein
MSLMYFYLLGLDLFNLGGCYDKKSEKREAPPELEDPAHLESSQMSPPVTSFSKSTPEAPRSTPIKIGPEGMILDLRQLKIGQFTDIQKTATTSNTSKIKENENHDRLKTKKNDVYSEPKMEIN